MDSKFNWVQNFELYSLYLDEENNVSKHKLNVEALGSGAKYAKWVLRDGYVLVLLECHCFFVFCYSTSYANLRLLMLAIPLNLMAKPKT